jgi:MYXO-CTERM domain-containing protein
LDADGSPNLLDVDSDGDHMPDALEGIADLDGDGIENYLDVDSDGDGAPDSVYGITIDGVLIPPDLDTDGIANHLDPDSDGDGISNVEEQLLDFDGDGLLNILDYDSDDDGLPDYIEGTADEDGDGEPDYLDADASDGAESDPDGDGLRTVIEELFELNPLDPDTDSDGIPDGLEFSPSTVSRDEGDPADTDLDGIIDALDEDSDGDGWPDAAEAPLDPSNPPDSDGDGIYDFRDLDSDNDGLSDAEELAAGTSPINGDSDGDGIPDGDELAAGSDPMGGAIAAELVAAEGGCMSSVSGGEPDSAASLLALLLLVGGLGIRRRRFSSVAGARTQSGALLLVLLASTACEVGELEAPEIAAAPPLLSVSGSLEVEEGSLVFLEASAIDADGPALTWQWEQTVGVDIVLLIADRARAVFLAPTTSERLDLEFSVTVTDSQGLSSQGGLSVAILPINEPPRVRAGPDQQVSGGDVVLLEGTVEDEDGSIADWLWSVVEDDDVALIEGDEYVAQFDAPEVDAEYSIVLELQATDDEGAVIRDQLQVLVTPAQGGGDNNSLPLVDAGVDQQVAEGDPVFLSASASDVDGTIVTTTWSQLSGPLVALSSETSLDTDFVAPPVLADTVLSFEVVVVDGDGDSSADQVAVIVGDVNQAPLVAAGPDQVVTGGALVTLSGQSADADGSITSTIWSQLGGATVSLSSPYAVGTSFVAPSSATVETLSFQLLCQDDGGATSTDLVEVEVLPVNQPPVVTVGAGQTVTSGAVVQLSGTATDGDGSVVEVIWVQTAGQSVVLSNPTGNSTQFTSNSTALEVLSFTFSATDDEGAKAEATVDVTVEVPVVVADPCCEALSPIAPGSALVCQDLAAFSCVSGSDPFCGFSEWDAIGAESYRGEGFFSLCLPAVTCN